MPRTPDIEIRIDPRDAAKYDATLAKLEGKPMYERADRALLAAGQKIVVPAAKREFAASRKTPATRSYGYQRTGHKPGEFSRKISARKARSRRFDEVAAVTVKPRTPLAHLVIQRVKPHSLATKRAGKSPFAAFGVDEVRATSGLRHGGSSGNPFMERAQERTEDAVAALVARDVFGAIR